MIVKTDGTFLVLPLSNLVKAVYLIRKFGGDLL